METPKSYRDEVSHMLDKAKRFDIQLQKLKDLNLDLVKKSENILSSLKKIVALKSNKCSVCYTREKRVVFQPCGHVFCANCADRLTTARSRCFTCRQNVENSFTIYI